MTSFGFDETVHISDAGEGSGRDRGATNRLLAEGDYPFEVVHFERSAYPGGQGKIKEPCGLAIYTLRVEDAEGAVEIRDRFYLVDSCIWKIRSFFEALDLVRHGDNDVKFPWEQAVGRRAVCHVHTNEYTNSRGQLVRCNAATKYWPTGKQPQQAQRGGGWQQQPVAAPQPAPAPAPQPAPAAPAVYGDEVPYDEHIPF